MTAFRVDTILLPNKEMETGRVQITATSSNMVLGNTKLRYPPDWNQVSVCSQDYTG